MASRRRPNRITSPVAGHAAKSLPAALTAPSAAGQATSALAAMQQLQAMRGGLAQPLPRDEYPYAFGPNVPLNPAPIDPVGPNGRAEPRLWEYPQSWNLPGSGQRIVPWTILREAAQHPLVRAGITIRKEEVAGLDWDFTISRRAVDEAQRNQPGSSRLDIETQLREQLRPAIEQARAFWRVPDKGNGFTFAEWTSAFLEEHLVLDAVPIYPRKTLGGQLFSFEVVDGSTVKPLLDHRGGRPLPPQPAYQQNLYGFPRGEFTADTSDTDGQLVIPNAYAADQMIYIRRENRVASPYGLSPVERCLLDLTLWMKRQDWLRSEYDDGVQPAGWLRWLSENTNGWTPQQVAEYERELNDTYSGNTAMRMRYRVLPPGLIPDDAGSNDQAERFKPEFDLHLMKLVMMHMAVTVHELGFPEQTGIGGSGHAEGQDRLNERRGRQPTLRWMAGVFTDMSRAHLALPHELEFSWLGLDDDTEQGDAITVTEQVAAGLLTLNEARDEDGRPRFSFPEADKPFINANGTVTFLEGIEARQQEQEAAQAEQSRAQLAALQQTGGRPQPAPDEPGGGASSAAPASGADADKAAEAAAYRRWVSKGRSTRRFELHTIASPSELQLYGIDPQLVTLGKGSARSDWPGWQHDEAHVAYWAPRIREALADVDVGELAAQYVAWQRGQQATKGVLGGAARRVADWLRSRLTRRIADALEEPLDDLARDAWALGEHAAEQVLGEHGDDAPQSGVEHDGVDERTDDARPDVERIAETYVEDIAEALTEDDEVSDETEPVETRVERLIRAVLDGEPHSELIAQTEHAYAQGAAALATYRRAGITRKRWLIAPDDRVCTICRGNADEGRVPLEQRFSSGDMHPPGHPRCRCAISPVVEGWEPEDLA